MDLNTVQPSSLCLYSPYFLFWMLIRLQGMSSSSPNFHRRGLAQVDAAIAIQDAARRDIVPIPSPSSNAAVAYRARYPRASAWKADSRRRKYIATVFPARDATLSWSDSFPGR